MRRVIPALAIAGALWTADVTAQGRNFAGNWTMDPEKTAAANAAIAAASGGGETGAVTARSGVGGGGRGGAAMGTATATATGGTMTAAGGGGGAVAVAGGGGGRGGAGGGTMRGGGAPTPMAISVNAGAFTVGSGDTATTYKIDGAVNTIQTARGEIKAKAAWKGDKLVIETTREGANGPVATTETWYLETESLVRETSGTSPNGQTFLRKTFYKKAS